MDELIVSGIGKGGSCRGPAGPTYGKHMINLAGTKLQIANWVIFEYGGSGQGVVTTQRFPQYSYQEGWGGCGHGVIKMSDANGQKQNLDFYIPLHLYLV